MGNANAYTEHTMGRRCVMIAMYYVMGAQEKQTKIVSDVLICLISYTRITNANAKISTLWIVMEYA